MLNKVLLSAILLLVSISGASNAVASNPLSSTLESIKETFVTSGEAKLFCRVTGQGKPWIVIHGGPGLTQDYLIPQMYELAKNNLVIFYDQRGCGKSTVDINANTITLESFVNDIEAIRQAFNLDKISILGHSWGGFLAMKYTIAHPEHVDKLILSNSAPATSEGYALFGQEYMRRMSPYQKELEKISSSQGFRDGNTCVMEQFYRLIFRQYCYIPEKADLLNLRMTPIASLNGAMVSEIIRENALDRSFNLHKGLKALKVSTLILHGDSDPIPPSTAQDIHENIPGSKYVLMKNCGHFPYVEDPATYFKYINEFLSTKSENAF